ncbi:hypothetical protein [Candidatus Mycoplasma mahonii]|uniref:hypothetical protein n=1 Tax=Candidatus Mycoplasma mahonii TaxID=3004105 RepID=UPI0026F35607|nr:hypothetical protein [Candidatus Mycoplasma mahonii]WKX02650.1 hypothetical protein O3I44_01045 [Candidatus Mycoplasma mahonii]
MNKQLFMKEIDAKYKFLFRKVIRQNLSKFNGVPIDWEDVYYEFLYYVEEINAKYDSSKGVNEASYLALQAKYFTLNKCRFYSTNKFKILNQAISLEDIYLPLSDVGVEIKENQFDLSVLNNLEIFVYKNNILDGISIRKISKECGVSYAALRRARISLKNKMGKQIE